MSFTEKRIDGKVIYSGKILKLTVDDVLLPDGKSAKREIIRHSSGVAVLFVRDERVLLVRQFRYAYNKEMYEIPAGMVNEGELPSVAAARELEEETGYKSELTHLVDIYPSPGYTDEIIHVYFAENSTRSRQNLDDGEFLTAEFIPLDRVLSMIENGEITDAKTVVAVYKYLLNKK